jgi:hypothetical protein
MVTDIFSFHKGKGALQALGRLNAVFTLALIKKDGSVVKTITMRFEAP